MKATIYLLKSPGFLSVLPQRVSAIGLVAASVGFASVFAWGQGSQHGVVLGVLSVAFAISLECAKPIAVGRATKSLGMAMLAVLAIGYSLTAELSLTAILKADAVAGREAGSRPVEIATATRDRAAGELASLASETPLETVGELQIRLEAMKADRLYTRSKKCTAITAPESVAHCEKVTGIRLQLDVAQHVAELRREAAEAEAVLARGGLIKKADPAIDALVTMLTVLRLPADRDVIGTVMLLVGVLSLEAGSALACGLWGSVSTPNAAVLGPVPATTEGPVVQAKSDEALQSGITQGVSMVQDAEQSNHREAVLVRLRSLGQGHAGLVGNQRDLAMSFGLPKTTLRRVLDGLVEDGLVAVHASAKGTTVKLAA
jgi:hypothetical protein